MSGLFEWLQATGVASAVGESQSLTAVLSSIHAVGFTLVTGSALVANLRLLGVFLREHAVATVTRPAIRGIAIGLCISGATGLLLFAPRAVAASANRTFRIKMLFLLSAVVFQIIAHRTASTRFIQKGAVSSAAGAVGLVLWTGLALAASAFILLE